MDLVKNNFLGKTPLWQVFWVQNFLIGGLLNFGVEKVAPYLPGILFFFLVAFAVLYSIWVVVGIWQCAFNANWKGWGYIVRGFYILILGIVLISFIQSI